MEKVAKMSENRVINVLATDVDGTLIDEDKKDLSEELKSFLHRWIAQGGIWLVASGRPTEMLQDFFQIWGVSPAGFVSENRYIYQGPKKYRPFPEWNRERRLEKRRIDKKIQKIFEELICWAGENQIERSSEQWIKFTSLKAAIRAESRLDNLTGKTIKAIRNKRYVSVISSRSGKGAALMKLLNELNLETKQTLCVGDSGNDREMLDGRYDFKAAASRQAEPEIKDIVSINGGLIFKSDLGIELSELLLNGEQEDL